MKWLKTKTRFNGRDAGAVFEASDEDARVWIEEGLAEEADVKEDSAAGKSAKGKAQDGPAKDKAIKAPEKKK